jgi:hypothetical protein
VATEEWVRNNYTLQTEFSTHNTAPNAHNDIRERINQLSSDKVDKSGMTLGVHTDGFVYLFINGIPQGNGLDIKADVIEGDVFGYVDENNVVVLNGALADGTYTIKYEMEDGSIINIGNLVLDNTVYYSITNTLTNCTNNNSAKQIAHGESYSATITANSGYELSSVKVTMGGTDVSTSAVSGGTISIANVTGNIVITAVAEEVTTVEPTNFCVVNRTVGTAYYADTDPTSPSYGWISGGRCSSAGDNRTDSATTCVTNYIPVQNGDVIYVKNLNISTSVFSGVYKDSYVAMKGIAMTESGAAGYLSNINLSGEWAQFTIANADIKFIRICGIPEQMTSTAGNKPFFEVVDVANLDIIVNIKRNGEWL